MNASFRCDKDVDGKMIADRSELAFQSARISDAAFRIIDETQHLRAPTSGTIALNVDAYLIGKVLAAEPRPRLLDDDGQAIVIEEKGGACRPIGIRRSPFVRANVIEMLTQQRMQEVLDVMLVFHVQCLAIFTTQPQLPCDGVKPLTEFFRDRDVIGLVGGDGIEYSRR